METATACGHAMVALHKQRGHENRLQEKGHRTGIRCRIGLTSPGTKAGVRHCSAMMMGGRFRVGMIDDAGNREERQDQVESCQRGRTSRKRCL